MANFINATIEQHEFDKVIVFPLLIKSPYKTKKPRMRLFLLKFSGILNTVSKQAVDKQAANK